MTEQEVIEQEEQEQKETVKEKKMPKPKKFYGIMSCEIIKENNYQDTNSWCSVCGYEGVPPMIMLRLRKGDPIWICYKCIQGMYKTLRGQRNLSMGEWNLKTSTVNRMQKARGPIKVPRNSIVKENKKRLKEEAKNRQKAQEQFVNEYEADTKRLYEEKKQRLRNLTKKEKLQGR
jgi:hypothetical protein